MTGPPYTNEKKYTNYLALSYKESKIVGVQLTTFLRRNNMDKIKEIKIAVIKEAYWPMDLEFDYIVKSDSEILDEAVDLLTKISSPIDKAIKDDDTALRVHRSFNELINTLEEVRGEE